MTSPSGNSSSLVKTNTPSLRGFFPPAVLITLTVFLSTAMKAYPFNRSVDSISRMASSLVTGWLRVRLRLAPPAARLASLISMTPFKRSYTNRKSETGLLGNWMVSGDIISSAEGVAAGTVAEGTGACAQSGPARTRKTRTFPGNFIGR